MIFFSKCSKVNLYRKKARERSKITFVFKKIAFELAVVNSPYFDEKADYPRSTC